MARKEPRIKDYRDQRGLTQTQLSALAGIGQQHLSALERGLIRPTVDTALKIARALGTTVEALWGDEPEPSTQDDEPEAASAPEAVA